MLLQDLQDKNIAIWGLGKEGTACLEFIKKHNITQSIKIFETDDDVNLSNIDIIIKSPGVSIYKEELVKAKKSGIKITSSSDLFLSEMRTNHPNCITIGISGSKGKSTSVSALYHILTKLGYKTGLGGNIGKTIIDLLDDDLDYAIGEFSSYQAADLTASPNIVMFTNLYYVHEGWHNGHENYCKDKIHLIANQKPGDVFYINDRNEQLKQYTNHIHNGKLFYNNSDTFHAEGKILFYQNTPLFSINDLKVSGDHNIDNLAGVFSILQKIGVDLNQAIEALKSFEPLEHRLQNVATFNNITFINDSISTAPEAAIGAMKSFDDNIVIISGGQDLNQNYTDYAQYVQDNSKIKAVITTFNNGPKIASAIKTIANRKDLSIIEASGMEEAVASAYKILHSFNHPGIILLSPTAPSFGAYKNFIERGNHFIATVQSLIKNTKPV